ncbi:MAG: hypothetical protein ACR2QL_11775 [Woeseiaceae bacterium]
MRKIIMLLASTALVAMSGMSLAQEDEEAPEMYTYASYYECSGPFAVADDSVAEDAERLNGLVDDGTIARWGWLAHHTGGQWSRVFYHQAESLDALLDGSDAITGAGDDGDGDEADEAVEDEADVEEEVEGPGCTRHDDYIWQVESGGSSETRGAAGFSVYHFCDSSREERADEIVAEHVAPIMDGLVEDGSLTSWGWSSHVVGGLYRRLQTMTAADHKSLLAARSAAIEAIYADDNDMGAELNDICGSHVDYMWDILHEK